MSRRRPARIARITVTGLSATGSLLMVSGMVIDGIHRAEASAPVPPTTTSVRPRPVRAVPSPTVAGVARPALPATTVAPAVPATVAARPAVVAPHPAPAQPVATAPARTTTTEAVTTTTEDTTTTTAPARSCGSRCR